MKVFNGFGCGFRIQLQNHIAEAFYGQFDVVRLFLGVGKVTVLIQILFGLFGVGFLLCASGHDAKGSDRDTQCQQNQNTSFHHFVSPILR